MGFKNRNRFLFRCFGVSVFRCFDVSVHVQERYLTDRANVPVGASSTWNQTLRQKQNMNLCTVDVEK